MSAKFAYMIMIVTSFCIISFFPLFFFFCKSLISSSHNFESSAIKVMHLTALIKKSSRFGIFVTVVLDIVEIVPSFLTFPLSFSLSLLRNILYVYSDCLPMSPSKVLNSSSIASRQDFCF